MFNQKIFKISVIVLAFVALLNYIGIIYEFYWFYKWYDIPVHILGGLAFSLFFLSIYSYFYGINKIFYKLLIAIFVITISWEIFELLIKSVFLSDGWIYWRDTLSDILDGYIGGILGYFWFKKKKIK